MMESQPAMAVVLFNSILAQFFLIFARYKMHDSLPCMLTPLSHKPGTIIKIYRIEVDLTL